MSGPVMIPLHTYPREMNTDAETPYDEDVFVYDPAKPLLGRKEPSPSIFVPFEYKRAAVYPCGHSFTFTSTDETKMRAHSWPDACPDCGMKAARSRILD